MGRAARRGAATVAGLPPTLDDGASVRDLDLFQLALGLESPWRVERSEFDATAKRLDLHIDFHPGWTFSCPECGIDRV